MIGIGLTDVRRDGLRAGDRRSGFGCSAGCAVDRMATVNFVNFGAGDAFALAGFGGLEG